MKKIIILGGSGFIGLNLVDHFSKKYLIIATYKNKKPSQKFKNTRWIKADLTKKINLKNFCKNAECVFICSAITSGAKNIVSKPEMFVSNNAIINTNIISGIYNIGIKHIFFFSCTVMYSNSNKAKGESDFNLETCEKKYYGGAVMKIYTENLCNFFSRISKTKFTVIRHSNTYGPYDKFNKSEGHFFCSAISKITNAKNEVKVWGPGKEKRNFIHIDDVINAIKILKKKQKNSYEIVNVADNKSYSIREIVKKMINCSKKNLKIVHDLSKPSINVDLLISSQKMKKKYKWKPQISIENGIRKTFDWYKKNY